MVDDWLMKPPFLSLKRNHHPNDWFFGVSHHHHGDSFDWLVDDEDIPGMGNRVVCGAPQPLGGDDVQGRPVNYGELFDISEITFW